MNWGPTLSRRVLLIGRADPLAVHLDGDGALEQVNGDDDPPFAFFLHQDALETFQRTADEADWFADAEVGPGLGGEPGAEDVLDSIDLFVGNRLGLVAEADDRHYARGSDDGLSTKGIEPAKYVAGKERGVYFDYAIRPAMTPAAEGKVSRIASIRESGRSYFFKSGTSADAKPGKFLRLRCGNG